MATRMTATVVDGMLIPDEPLPLREQERVKSTIEPWVDQPDPMEARQSLKAWIQQNPLHGLGRHLTRNELHERR